MKKILEFGLVSTLLLWSFGCAAESSDKAAADTTAQVTAATHLKSKTTPAAKPYAQVQTRFVIPTGTPLKVSLTDTVDTGTSSAGERFSATLSEPVIVDGKTVLQQGTQLRGRIVSIEGSGRVKGLASIQLALTDIVQGNIVIPITTAVFTATADSSKKRDGEIIAGGAGLGALIGAIAGGGKGAGIGALTGGGAGTGVVLATKGKEIHYGPETTLNFSLANSVQM